MIVAKVEGESVGRRGPATNRRQRPDFQNLFGSFVEAQDRVFRHAQQARGQFVFALHFFLDENQSIKLLLNALTDVSLRMYYLDQEESDTVSAEGAGRFDVGHFGFDLRQSVVFLVLAKNLLFYAFDFHVRLR